MKMESFKSQANSNKSSNKIQEQTLESSSEEDTTDIFDRIEDKLDLREMPFMRKS